MIEEIETLIDKYYDLNEDVDDLLFEKLLKFAKTDKEEFIRYVNNQVFGTESNRPILYESIMDNANGWEDFLFDQIRLIIEQSESGNKEAESEIYSIYYLTNISALKSSFYKDTIEYFESKLYSSNTKVKSAALEYLIDLYSYGNLYIELKMRKMLQVQLYDKDYKVRLSALIHLAEDKLLPKGYKQNIMDKIRTWFNFEYRSLMKSKEIGKNVAQQIMNKNF